MEVASLLFLSRKPSTRMRPITIKLESNQELRLGTLADAAVSAKAGTGINNNRRRII
jgi:hypothetical protein